MHSNNLGLYLVANGEGLHILAEHKCASWGCTWDESLHFLYDEFRNWCARNRVTTSQRRWTSHHLHTQTKDGPCFVWLQAKAFNSRLILAWLAETKHHYEITVWIVWTTFFFTPRSSELKLDQSLSPRMFCRKPSFSRVWTVNPMRTSWHESSCGAWGSWLWFLDFEN
jgi:hypothetical protein